MYQFNISQSKSIFTMYNSIIASDILISGVIKPNCICISMFISIFTSISKYSECHKDTKTQISVQNFAKQHNNI